ncbi:hypothetical protein GGD83_004988 [Rhodoblastus sphagnicola]|uniref:hypothetical protein n=1 Tax=Rhodoblastus sphagnicola TaxID=333368 RepID=UPI00161518E7|nr:hypothetical protein [Rhodoblastus sphagnicola]MBB4201150.1 hypothetical protein [Rhodoblastus sphagnicola]
MDDLKNPNESWRAEPELTENTTEEMGLGTLVKWSDFVARLDEIYALRHREVTPFDLKVASSVYNACSKALGDFQQSTTIWRTVSAPAGGGKTTAVFAFVAALVRVGGSALFLANTKRECDEAYRILASMLLGKAAIRTTDHDQEMLDALGSKYVDDTKAREDGYEPAEFFRRAQLGEFPALVGTHNGFKQHPGQLQRLADGQRRTLILVDERPDDIDVADFTLAEFELIHGACVAKGLDDHGEEPALTTAFGEACRQLSAAQAGFDRSRPYHELRISLDTPLIDALRRLASSQASRVQFVQGTSIDQEKLRLAARLVIMAQETHGFAFAALNTQFSYGRPRFVAYAPNWPQLAGVVLLDATSDIDGYAELSTVRVQEEVPEANYAMLEAVHLDGPQYLTRNPPQVLWKKTKTRGPLLKWMRRSVLENTKEGESILIVSWKNVVEGGQLQLLDWQQRDVHFCHFGAGIGSNQWRACEAVFMFGSYVKPTRTIMAETLAIKEQPFQATGDATVRGLKGDYEITKIGLMLRWFKQLAMRGCARELDADGLGKPMRLYFSNVEFQILIDYWKRMFPGAAMPKNLYVDDDTQGQGHKPGRRKSRSDDLLKVLATISITKRIFISSTEIKEATGIELKSAMMSLKKDQTFLDSCSKLGWTYASATGQGQKAGFLRT